MTLTHSALRISSIKDTHCFYFAARCPCFIGVLSGRYFSVPNIGVSRPKNKANQGKK